MFVLQTSGLYHLASQQPQHAMSISSNLTNEIFSQKHLEPPNSIDLLLNSFASTLCCAQYLGPFFFSFKYSCRSVELPLSSCSLLPPQSPSVISPAGFPSSISFSSFRFPETICGPLCLICGHGFIGQLYANGSQFYISIQSFHLCSFIFWMAHEVNLR